MRVKNKFVNIDYNLISLFSNSSERIIKLIYKILRKNNYSELNIPVRGININEKQFITIVKNNIFICHNLLYGIPLESDTVDGYYSSHMIGFAFNKEESIKLLKDVYRTLKLNGIVRFSLVDGDYYWKDYDMPNFIKKRFSNDNCFTYSEICTVLLQVGFKNIKKSEYKNGINNVLNELDNYSPEVDEKFKEKTMYIEVTK